MKEPVIALGLWLLILSWGMHMGCGAYHATPNIEPFQAFAQPDIRRPPSSGESKIFFLFSPLMFACAYSLISQFFSTDYLDARLGDLGSNTHTGRLYIASLATLLMCFVVASRSHDAISAALQAGWHGISAPNAAVDDLCAVTSWGS